MAEMKESETTIAKLTDFVAQTEFKNLPAEVVQETKRVLLDSIGCGLGGTVSDKGKWGLEFCRQHFSGPSQSTVIGFGDKMSAMGAAFVNGELINALDYDAILPPGHVSPFVIPAILAAAEMAGASGKDVITACALAHEISTRVGGALSYYRDVVDGKVVWPAVAGYSCCVFGGAGGVAKIKKFSKDGIGNAMSMAGHIAPIQAMTSWATSRRPTTAKYLLAGWTSQAELTATSLVEIGHSGNVFIMDGDYGFWRFAGSPKWNAAPVVDGLGKVWRFPAVTSYKPFPCCRIFAGVLDCLTYIVEKENLKPEEIESIKAYPESNIAQPLFQERAVVNQSGVQFNVAYNLAVAAHGVKPGPRWQSTEMLRDKRILGFMEKISYEPHPGFAKALQEDPRSRIAKVEVKARGKVFTEERKFPKGSPSPDPGTFTTNEELAAKFRDNASHIIPSNKVDEAIDRLLELESVGDVRKIMGLVSV